MPRPHRGNEALLRLVPPPRLTARAASRDPLLDRIEELYSTDFARFVRVAAAITGDVESARDVVQDAFANLIVHRAEYREESPLGGWAWRAVVNAAYSERRARAYAGRAVARLESLRQPEASNEAPDAELREAIRDLPERQRTMVFLRYYADLDYTAIAEALSVSPGTVGAALNAARATLRGIVGVDVAETMATATEAR